MRKPQSKCWPILALTATLLTGCETTNSSCPALARYSPEFQKAAADQLVKAGAEVRTLVTDYGRFRDACRAMDAIR